MTGDHAEDIGTLKANSKRDGKNIDALFNSNEKRKQDVKDLELSVQSIQHTVEETNQTVNGVAASMEELKTLIKHMDGRITALETERFDWVKVFKWLGTWCGTFFLIAVSAMLIGAIFPDAREWINGLIGVAVKAGVK